MENHTDLASNPAYQEARKQIANMITEDLSKSEIREKLTSALPEFPSSLFELAFSEAFSDPLEYAAA